MKQAIKRKIYFLFFVILFFINLLSFGFISIVRGDSRGLFSNQSVSVHQFVENQNFFIQGNFLKDSFWWGKPDLDYRLCESFSPNFTKASSGIHSINYKVLDIGDKEAGCFTPVYVKEPSCSIILDSPSTEMSVGSTLKLTIKKECITLVTENPYALQVLL
jgi:hypothetical protein